MNFNKYIKSKKPESETLLAFWKEAFKELDCDFYAPNADILRRMIQQVDYPMGSFECAFLKLKELIPLIKPIDPNRAEGMNVKKAVKMLTDVRQAVRRDYQRPETLLETAFVEEVTNALALWVDWLEDTRQIKNRFSLIFGDISNRDTIIREYVPPAVYYWLRNLARQEKYS